MNLIKASATVGGMTLMSRVLGFVRDILIARYLGSGPIAEAYVVAFRIPNLFRRITAEGAFNSAFVPLYAKRLQGEGPASARRFAEEAASVMATGLLILCVAAQIAMPFLMPGLAPGFADEPGKFETAVDFTTITFPYLLFISLVALMGGVLNSHGKYFAVGAVPVLLNVVMIAAIVLLTPLLPSAGHALVWGIALAGVAQLCAMAWAVRRNGIVLRLRRPRLTPAVKRLLRLTIPGVVSGGVTQINLLVGTMIATLQAGAVSWLYYADRVYQLPLGVVGVAMGVVLLPEIARRLRAGDPGGANWNQNRGLELALMLTLPAALALAVIPEPIARVLFERGAYTADDSAATGLALSIFAFGLPAFVLIKVFSPGFYAREDTATPMWFAIACVILNTALGVSLFFWIGFAGIPIAEATAAWTNVGLLAFTLWRRGHYTPDAQLKRRLSRVVLASIAMGVALWFGNRELSGYWDDTLVVKVSAMAALCFGGLAIFVALLFVTGALRRSDLKSGFGR
jgi:putative peptidoglycan lipid II flippase